MAEIGFSPEAITDLQQTKAYITEELCNEHEAIGTVAKITKRIRMPASFPESSAPLSSIVDFETDYRFLVCGNYTAFYRIENQTVNIIRVLYGRRNFMQILFGEPSDNGIPLKEKTNRHLKRWRFFIRKERSFYGSKN